MSVRGGKWIDEAVANRFSILGRLEAAGTSPGWREAHDDLEASGEFAGFRAFEWGEVDDHGGALFVVLDVIEQGYGATGRRGTGIKQLIEEARIVDRLDDGDLVDSFNPDDYRAAVEPVFLFKVMGYDWNCPQLITPRFTRAEIEAGMAAI